MENHKEEEKPQMPEWLLKSENYVPTADKDTFINKSILSLFQVISRIKTQDSQSRPGHSVSVPIKVLFTFLLLLLLSLSKNFFFILAVNVCLLLLLSLLNGETIIKILRPAVLMTAFTLIIMLPALFWGYGRSAVTITFKVFATVTAVSLLTHTSRWSEITGALKIFFVPDIFILVLDITVKYIVMLGDFTLNMLYALKLRSVGRNRDKYASLSGVAGTMFVKSKEMAEEMYSAMECRGFTGEYRIYRKLRLTAADWIYIVLHAGIFLLFLALL